MQHDPSHKPVVEKENITDQLHAHGLSPTASGEKHCDPETLGIDHVSERKLVRKLDLHIVPVVMLLYLLSFLDRVNIGNARLYGMEKDLGLKGNEYQTAVSLLFVTYILSELPSNLVLKRFRPSRWISFITTSWGIIATLTGLTKNYAGLIVCRLFLGAVEGGLFPGMAIYLTLFYTKREIALRIGYLFVSAALAGALGGLLAYGIGFMDGGSLPFVYTGIRVTWVEGVFFISQASGHAKAFGVCTRKWRYEFDAEKIPSGWTEQNFSS